MKPSSIIVAFSTVTLVACGITSPSVDRTPYAIVSNREHKDLVERALSALYNDYKRSWFFTETSTADGQTKVANYDPRKIERERWTLVSINGRAPNDKNKRSFREDKLKQREKVKERDATIGRRATVRVRPGTLKLRQETSTHWVFDFVPAEEGGDDKIMRYVNGALRISKNGHYVESVVLKNDAPIIPFIGSKISNLLVRQEFAPANSAGPIVPISLDIRMKGSAFLAIRFNRSEVRRFTNYKKVGGGAGEATAAPSQSAGSERLPTAL